jgi:hypothetical protein
MEPTWDDVVHGIQSAMSRIHDPWKGNSRRTAPHATEQSATAQLYGSLPPTSVSQSEHSPSMSSTNTGYIQEGENTTALDRTDENHPSMPTMNPNHLQGVGNMISSGSTSESQPVVPHSADHRGPDGFSPLSWGDFAPPAGLGAPEAGFQGRSPFGSSIEAASHAHSHAHADQNMEFGYAMEHSNIPSSDGTMQYSFVPSSTDQPLQHHTSPQVNKSSNTMESQPLPSTSPPPANDNSNATITQQKPPLKRRRPLTRKKQAVSAQDVQESAGETSQAATAETPASTGKTAPKRKTTGGSRASAKKNQPASKEAVQEPSELRDDVAEAETPTSGANATTRTKRKSAHTPAPEKSTRKRASTKATKTPRITTPLSELQGDGSETEEPAGAMQDKTNKLPAAAQFGPLLQSTPVQYGPQNMTSNQPAYSAASPMIPLPNQMQSYAPPAGEVALPTVETLLAQGSWIDQQLQQVYTEWNNPSGASVSPQQLLDRRDQLFAARDNIRKMLADANAFLQQSVGMPMMHQSSVAHPQQQMFPIHQNNGCQPNQQMFSMHQQYNGSPQGHYPSPWTNYIARGYLGGVGLSQQAQPYGYGAPFPTTFNNQAGATHLTDQNRAFWHNKNMAPMFGSSEQTMNLMLGPQNHPKAQMSDYEARRTGPDSNAREDSSNLTDQSAQERSSTQSALAEWPPEEVQRARSSVKSTLEKPIQEEPGMDDS